MTEAKPHSVTDSRKRIRAYYETNRAGWHQGVTIKLADAEKREPIVGEFAAEIVGRVTTFMDFCAR